MALVIEKPSSLDDFVLIPETRAKLEAVIDGTVSFPANGVSTLLLYGSFGTGKTTMAYLLPGWLETTKTTDALRIISVGKLTDTQSPYYDFHSCAQGQNGANLISTIQQRCSLVSLNTSNLHFVILDEVDNLTVAAHASLKAVMNYTHVVFIITTNNLDKVDKGIINRSILLNMNAAPTNAWVEKIEEIYLQSNLLAPPESAIASIVNAGYGSARTIFTDIEIAEAKRNKLTGSKPN
jgi:DNA polymerase III delta prime subunit